MCRKVRQRAKFTRAAQSVRSVKPRFAPCNSSASMRWSRRLFWRSPRRWPASAWPSSRGRARTSVAWPAAAAPSCASPGMPRWSRVHAGTLVAAPLEVALRRRPAPRGVARGRARRPRRRHRPAHLDAAHARRQLVDARHPLRRRRAARSSPPGRIASFAIPTTSPSSSSSPPSRWPAARGGRRSRASAAQRARPVAPHPARGARAGARSGLARRHAAAPALPAARHLPRARGR